jgi:GDP-4-dehydro-6-deoxy-D-mannose reductase
VITSLVTGAGGFAGQHLLRELLQNDHEVVGGSVDGEPPRSGVLSPRERARVQWIPLDIRVAEQIQSALSLHRPDRIFHLAAQSSVGQSFADVLGTWDLNATSTLRLMRAIIETVPSSRVLVVSSSEVYGIVPEEEQPISEARPLAPVNPYGASKAAAEIVARQLCGAAGVGLVIARSFSHIGPGQSLQFALPNWGAQLSQMARGTVERVLRVGNLEARRDLLDVRDVVRAYRLLIENGESGRVYNVCAGTAHRLADVVQAMVELSDSGARIEVEAKRLRPVDIPLILGDASRLRDLGWSPAIELRQTLMDLLEANRDIV